MRVLSRREYGARYAGKSGATPRRAAPTRFPRRGAAPINTASACFVAAWASASVPLAAASLRRSSASCRIGARAPPVCHLTITASRQGRGSGMLGGVDGEPVPPPERRREIDTRLNAIRARLNTLRERDREAMRSRTATPGERVEAARRHAVEAYVAAAEMLASSAEAFRNAAEAHDRAASMHERAGAAGSGDVRGHERQAAVHQAAAAADRQRAERALSLLSEPGRAGPDEPRDGVAP